MLRVFGKRVARVTQPGLQQTRLFSSASSGGSNEDEEESPVLVDAPVETRDLKDNNDTSGGGEALGILGLVAAGKEARASLNGATGVAASEDKSGVAEGPTSLYDRIEGEKRSVEASEDVIGALPGELNLRDVVGLYGGDVKRRESGASMRTLFAEAQRMESMDMHSAMDRIAWRRTFADVDWREYGGIDPQDDDDVDPWWSHQNDPEYPGEEWSYVSDSHWAEKPLQSSRHPDQRTLQCQFEDWRGSGLDYYNN